MFDICKIMFSKSDIALNASEEKTKYVFLRLSSKVLSCVNLKKIMKAFVRFETVK